MKYITFILSLLGFLVASILLVPSFDSCAPKLRAQRRCRNPNGVDSTPRHGGLVRERD